MKLIYSKFLLISSVLLMLSSCSVEEDDLLNSDLESFIPQEENNKKVGGNLIIRTSGDPTKSK